MNIIAHLRPYNFPKGEQHPKWKGGRRRASNGYIWVYSPDHPRRSKQNRVLEHRLVMERVIGRYLEPHEIVHHRNGERDDNRPENLELMSNGQNVALSNASRPITNTYRKKRRKVAQRLLRDASGKFTKSGDGKMPNSVGGNSIFGIPLSK